MKKTTAVCLGLVLAAVGCGDIASEEALLDGVAEDLWGQKIDLGASRNGVTLILPFSPSNCGYCLFDGEFVDENYVRANTRAGGSSFYQCLFNPQLDIYTYTKHYRNDRTPVLTFPHALHRLHRNGFPFIAAFQDGKPAYTGPLSPYEVRFRELSQRLWPGQDGTVVLTSPLFMAGDFAYWNRQEQSVLVVADGDLDGFRQANERNERNPDAAVPVKYEQDLTSEDLEKTLVYRGETERFRFDGLATEDSSEQGALGLPAPVHFDSTSISIGHYRFPISEVSVAACFPNPHFPERYVLLRVHGKGSAPPAGADWADYAVFGPSADGGSPEILLHGLFDKKERNCWTFAPSLAFASAAAGRFCSGGSCPAPPFRGGSKDNVDREVELEALAETAAGPTWLAGNSSCRFPAVATDPDGVAWVAWEEAGDILLTSVNRPGDQQTAVIEGDAADSFHPVLVADADRSLLWLFYLSDRDGFYRVYARYLDEGRPSEEILISRIGAFDAVTPAAAAGSSGRLVVAWSEWKANQRFLLYRTIERRVLGDIRSVAVKRPAIDYVNAWYPSLVLGEGGQVRGAWNQHYPATLGVCAGNLVDEASSVTRLHGSIEENENGGYPSIVIDGGGRTWVFWDSFAWDVLAGKPQRILASCDEEGSGQWSLPYAVSRDEQTFLNQTPRAAVDRDGVIHVVWSGRDAAGERPWAIYLSSFAGGRWSAPERLSEEGECARAPAIAAGRENELWIAWHSGVGEGMRIRVLRCEVGAGATAEAIAGDQGI